MKLGHSTRLSSAGSLIVAAQILFMLCSATQSLAAGAIEPAAPPATTSETTLMTKCFLANRKALTPTLTSHRSGGDPRTAVPVPSSPFERTRVQLGADEIAAEARLREVLAEILDCGTNAIKDGSFQVSAASGKMANYNERNHLLLVRATQADLDRIEDLLYPLNRTRRQFEIAIQWLAVDPQEADAALSSGKSKKTKAGDMQVTAIMQSDKAEAMIELLSRQKSSRQLAAPLLTARDNRECALALSEHGLRLSLLPSLVNETKAIVNLDAQLEIAWNPGESSLQQSSRAQMKPGEVMVISQHFTAKAAAGKPQKPDVFFFISPKLLPPTTIPSWAMADPGKKSARDDK